MYYKRQQNFYTNLRKTKQKYFCNLNMKDLNDKRFWKKIKPFFLDKGLQANNIIPLKTKLD